MDEIRRALLGDRAAQERLTERGVLLPCPMCKSKRFTRTVGNSFWCADCLASISFPGFISLKECLKRMNNRAPILSAEEMEMLEGIDDG